MTRPHRSRPSRTIRPLFLETLEDRTLLTAIATASAVVVSNGDSATAYIVAANRGPVSGTVTFTDGASHTYGTATVFDESVGNAFVGTASLAVALPRGLDTVVATYSGDGSFAASHASATARVNSSAIVTFGAPAGQAGIIHAIDFNNGVSKTFQPFGSFAGAINVAAGDINGDGVPDLVVAVGSGGPPLVQILNFRTGQVEKSFLAFDSSFRGGVTLAVGDLNGDGKDDIITGMASGGSQIREFSGADGSLLASMSPFGAFTGGVRLASGFINTDADADLAVVTGPGADILKVFLGDSTSAAITKMYAGSLKGGAYVAIGDYDHNSADGDEIVVGTGAGDPPVVEVITLSGTLLAHFSYIPLNTVTNAGVYVGLADLNHDGADDFILNLVTTNAITIDDGLTHTVNHALTAIFAGITGSSPGFSLSTYVQPQLITYVNNDSTPDLITNAALSNFDSIHNGTNISSINVPFTNIFAGFNGTSPGFAFATYKQIVT